MEIDNGGACRVLFLDLAKAFDTVAFEVLLEKLILLVFKSNARNWFRLYLSMRSQVTMVDGVSSSPGHLSSSMPQGSILGPLLFTCYINDNNNNNKNNKPNSLPLNANDLYASSYIQTMQPFY